MASSVTGVLAVADQFAVTIKFAIADSVDVAVRELAARFALVFDVVTVVVEVMAIDDAVVFAVMGIEDVALLIVASDIVSRKNVDVEENVAQCAFARKSSGQFAEEMGKHMPMVALRDVRKCR